MRVTVCREDFGTQVGPGAVKVTVDDVDVTNRCHTADDESGEAWCWLHNENGELYLVGSELAAEVLRDHVVIEMLP